MATLAENRKARFDYNILDTYEAGVELKGFEVKAVKAGKMNLAGAFGTVRGNELWLINAEVPPYQPGNTPKEYESSRPRRLLLKASEIRELIGKMKERGLTLIALRAYTKGNLVKIELGLGRGKRGPDKRESIKKREAAREIARTMRG